MVEWPHTSPWDSAGLTVKWGILSPLLEQTHAHTCVEIHTRIQTYTIRTHMKTHTPQLEKDTLPWVTVCYHDTSCLESIQPLLHNQTINQGTFPTHFHYSHEHTHTHTYMGNILNLSPLILYHTACTVSAPAIWQESGDVTEHPYTSSISRKLAD